MAEVRKIEVPKIDVNESLTRQVAELARLELTDDEVSLFTQQIGGILKYVEKLQTIDVSGVEPLTHPLENEGAGHLRPFREDEAVLFPEGMHGGSKVLDCAPDVMEGGFKVPPIL